MKENAAARDESSPFQMRNRGKTWRAPTLKDFLRQLAWRLNVGPVYAVLPVDENRRADIIAHHATEDRMFCLWTYPGIGLRAMEESGFIVMTEAPDIPGYEFDHIMRQEGAVERFGEIPEIRRLTLPEKRLRRRHPRENDAPHRRLRPRRSFPAAAHPRLRRCRSPA